MMSEKLRIKGNENYKEPSYDHLELHKNNNEIAKESSEALSKNIEQIRKAVEAHSDSTQEKAKTAEHFKHATHEKTEHRHYITKKIKADKYRQTLSDIRQQLSRPNKAFSKVVHQPIIESASEIGAKTIARPSGVLIGGVVGLFGSILTLFYASNIGFAVPASAYPALFIIGYLAGLTLEFSYKLFTKNRKKQSALSYK